jgi:hypothetical protein
MTYTVRVKDVGNLGIFTQADHWTDHVIESPASLPALAAKLARDGFQVGDDRWIMPGAILWIKKKVK